MSPGFFTAAALVAALLGWAAPAQAQAFRAYLASDGVDNPACSRSAPCRLLPAALAAVADGGEVWMLDSANYNTAAVPVTKSVTILAVPGALGSVLSIGSSAIQVSTPGVEVALRNLVIVPLPGSGALHGVAMSSGDRLTVQDCTFANLPGMGIYAENGMAVRIIDSTFRDNGVGVALKNGVRAVISGSTFSGSGGSGIDALAAGSATVTTVDISDSVINANTYYGLLVRNLGGSPIRAAIRDSVLAGNGGGGMLADSETGEAYIAASNNLVSSSANHGVDVYRAGARVFSAGNVVVNNTAPGFRNGGGLLESTGDNAVAHNAFAVNGPMTPVVMK